MEFTIGKKTYHLYFGTGFVRELDRIRAVDMSGVKFGMGISVLLPSLQAYDTAALADVIYAATVRTPSRPGTQAIEDVIDEMDEKRMESLFAEVRNEIKESNATKLAAKNLKA